jgi:hypothetical protein
MFSECGFTKQNTEQAATRSRAAPNGIAGLAPSPGLPDNAASRLDSTREDYQ